ncbi:hypothetical protein CJF30_00011337 [Rutstroemia sp. NJR-2017a BBW]|nr:hypothetical protein CJF30_00011337 [Rutstroemia sp. NJR-2017a BBW]
MSALYKSSFWLFRVDSSNRHLRIGMKSCFCPYLYTAATITASNTVTAMTIHLTMAGAVRSVAWLLLEAFHLSCKCSTFIHYKKNIIVMETTALDVWAPLLPLLRIDANN